MLAAMFARAMADDLIRLNPFKGAAKGKTQGKAKRIFQPHEIEAMISVAPTQWWRVFIRLAVSTGFRRNELLNLHWTDVDLEHNEVTVSRKDLGSFTVAEVSYPILPFQAKDHESRTVPLPAVAVEALNRFRMTAGGSLYIFLGLDRLREIGQRVTAGIWSPAHVPVNNLIRDFRVIQKHARAFLAKQLGVSVD